MYELGDKVSVDLPGGKYTGRVTKVIPDYWIGETAYEVQGEDPVPFVTTARRIKRAEDGKL